MTGMFTDNQPDFTFLKPYEEKTFVQYFMPYKNVGAVKNASTEVVMNLELDNDTANITVYSPIQLDDVTIKFVYDGNKMFEEKSKHITDRYIYKECSYA